MASGSWVPCSLSVYWIKQHLHKKIILILWVWASIKSKSFATTTFILLRVFPVHAKVHFKEVSYSFPLVLRYPSLPLFYKDHESAVVDGNIFYSCALWRRLGMYLPLLLFNLSIDVNTNCPKAKLVLISVMIMLMMTRAPPLITPVTVKCS